MITRELFGRRNPFFLESREFGAKVLCFKPVYRKDNENRPDHEILAEILRTQPLLDGDIGQIPASAVVVSTNNAPIPKGVPVESSAFFVAEAEVELPNGQKWRLNYDIQYGKRPQRDLDYSERPDWEIKLRGYKQNSPSNQAKEFVVIEFLQ